MVRSWYVGQYEYRIAAEVIQDGRLYAAGHEKLQAEGWNIAWADHSVGGSFFVYRRLLKTNDAKDQT